MDPTSARFRLSRNNLLRLVIPVPERAEADLHLGEMIDVKVSTTGKPFSGNVLRGGHTVAEAVARTCRIWLWPILMTSLATVVGLLPMASLEAGSQAYTPLARAIIGGLLSSIVLTIFEVPAAYLLIYRRREQTQIQRLLGEV